MAFNHSIAVSQVDELKRIASDIRKVRSDIDSAIRKSNAAWDGQASGTYLTKAKRLKDLLSDEATDLRNLATSLKTAADRVKREMDS